MRRVIVWGNAAWAGWPQQAACKTTWVPKVSTRASTTTTQPKRNLTGTGYCLFTAYCKFSNMLERGECLRRRWVRCEIKFLWSSFAWPSPCSGVNPGVHGMLTALIGFQPSCYKPSAKRYGRNINGPFRKFMKLCIKHRWVVHLKMSLLFSADTTLLRRSLGFLWESPAIITTAAWQKTQNLSPSGTKPYAFKAINIIIIIMLPPIDRAKGILMAPGSLWSRMPLISKKHMRHKATGLILKRI